MIKCVSGFALLLSGLFAVHEIKASRTITAASFSHDHDGQRLARPARRLHEADNCSAEVTKMREEFQDRIVGGVPVNPPFRYPYIVNIVRFGVQEYCGGTLIAPNVVVTAAHCDKSLMSVWIGRHDLANNTEAFERIAIVEKAYPPIRWNPATNDNDIMLLRLETVSHYPPVAIDNDVRKQLQLVSEVEKGSFGPRVTIIGWVSRHPHSSSPFVNSSPAVRLCNL